MFNFAKKTVLITGGAGFIGSNIAKYLKKNFHCKVIIFDTFRTKKPYPTLGAFKNLLTDGQTPDFSVISGDIQDLGALQDVDFDVIFHEAAISDTTQTDERLMLSVNFHAFQDLVSLAQKRGAKMVYASSAGVYGNATKDGLNTEGQNERPENIYGYSKLLMDNFTRQILKTPSKNGFSLCGLRYFNVFGDGEFFKNTTASMILQLSLSILRENSARLFEFGEQKRDFVHIDDVVLANILAVGHNGVYNVGSGVARSFNDITQILKKELKNRAKTCSACKKSQNFSVEYIKNPYAFFQNHTEADLRAIKYALNFTPQHTLETGIAQYFPKILECFHANFTNCS